jgi:kojibiose phosphorylase
MAQWNLETAEAAAKLLAGRLPMRWQALSCRLGLEGGEAASWLQIARNLYTGFDERTGLFEQFRGYFDLEEIDLAAFQSRTAPMDVLLGRERTQGSKIIKQPDVVMLICLLWERFPPDARRVNFEYYEPRCGHGSSLSPAIHALVAARLGEIALAERYFRQAAEIDLADSMGNAAGGIHAAAMGGLWQAAVFGFAGIRLTQDGPELHPRLPRAWRSLSMRIQWRGQTDELTVAGQSTRATPGGDQ